MTTIAILHPGEMGAAIAASLATRGLRTVWASAGRSADTRMNSLWFGDGSATNRHALEVAVAMAV